MVSIVGRHGLEWNRASRQRDICSFQLVISPVSCEVTHGEPLNTSSLPTVTSGSSHKAGDVLKPSQTPLSSE